MTASITLTQINYLLALEKAGSFSKAAEKCFVTQSTLSTMIKKLENQVGFSLFNRNSKPIIMTDEGLLLLNQFRRIQLEADNLQELIQEAKNEFYGTIRIGIIPTVAPFLLPLFLEKLIENCPKVNFSIDEITTQEIISRIKERELDLGILSLPLGDKELVEHSLYFEEFHVFDARRPDVKSKYKVKDIDPDRLWLLEEGHCMTTQIEKICHLRAQKQFNNNLAYNSGSILSLLELVKSNKGITLIPHLATLRKYLFEEDCIYTFGAPVPVREIGIITHPNFAKKRLLTILIKEISRVVKPLLNKRKKVQVIKPY